MYISYNFTIKLSDVNFFLHGDYISLIIDNSIKKFKKWEINYRNVYKCIKLLMKCLSTPHYSPYMFLTFISGYQKRKRNTQKINKI